MGIEECCSWSTMLFVCIKYSIITNNIYVDNMYMLLDYILPNILT